MSGPPLEVARTSNRPRAPDVGVLILIRRELQRRCVRERQLAGLRFWSLDRDTP